MNTEENKSAVFGYHLMVDLYGCDNEKINSLDFCYQFLDELPSKIQMDKQSPPFLFRSPENYPGKAGLSGWVPLIQSGMSIHTLIDTGFVSVDVYSCLCFDKDFVTSMILDYFPSTSHEVNYLKRGIHYFD